MNLARIEGKLQACLHCIAVKELRSRDVAAATMHKVASQFRELHELQLQADHDLRRVDRESATGRKKVTDLNVAYTYAICLQVWKWAMSPFGVTSSLPQGDSLVQNQLSNQTWADVEQGLVMKNIKTTGHRLRGSHAMMIGPYHASQARFAQQFETDTHVPQVVVVNELEDLEMTFDMVGRDPTCRPTSI